MFGLLRDFFARPTLLVTTLAAGFSLGLMGCESNSDDFDHDPPAGMGTLYVVNNTPNDCDVFIDGARVGGVSDDDREWYDLEPGVRRGVVDQDDSYRVFRGDVDVLEGQRTILELNTDPTDLNRFDWVIYFD